MFQKNCHTLTHLFIDMFSHPTLIRNKKKKAKLSKTKKDFYNVRSNVKVMAGEKNVLPNHIV